MRLLRIQVPNFRVLQNVDITFEKDFFPSIFPLGSQNGGGKSTLLQLIFGLLHCSGNPERLDFLKNLLYGVKIYDIRQNFALIDIWDGEKIIRLSFSIEKKVTLKISPETNDRISATIWDEDANNMAEIEICKYSSNGDDKEDHILFCHLDNIDITKGENFLEKLSQKIFLAAPATQVFLFLSANSRKLLFKERTKKSDYNSDLQNAKSKLPGLFTYDFLAVDLMAKALRSAIAEDLKQITETGKYGNNYKELIEDLHLI